jgi:hypothetical protein
MENDATRLIRVWMIGHAEFLRLILLFVLDLTLLSLSLLFLPKFLGDV